MAKRGRPTGWDLIRRGRLATDAHKKRVLDKAARHRARPEYKAKYAAYRRAERAVRREHGICMRCGKEDAFKPFTLCPECLEKSSHKTARYARKKKGEKTMMKSEFVEKVATRSGLSKAKAEEAANSVIETLKELLQEGDTITFVGFGAFKVVSRPERNGRNPRTGEEMTIPAKKAVVFKSSPKFTDKLNKQQAG